VKAWFDTISAPAQVRTVQSLAENSNIHQFRASGNFPEAPDIDINQCLAGDYVWTGGARARACLLHITG
jgi:hypothetical protein